MEKIANPILLDFPMKGQWMAPNSPGNRIPSHGTDMFGQRYAYDFFQVDKDKKGYHFHSSSKAEYFLFGVKLKECFCWDAAIFAPESGKIVAAADGYPERQTVWFFSDMVTVLKNAFTFNPSKNSIQQVTGNYILMEISESVFAFFAHLRNGSVKVKAGDYVEKGKLIGNIGHSGNSTAPHLHFHLMDKPDFFSASGLPCAFRNMEVYINNEWSRVNEYIPKGREIFRSIMK